ncbi:putative tumor suppressing sub-chromosomal transferable candidate 4 [Rosa chinensis]|uniref:U5 small nuclear ribonucleoprotein TSSC4 n=1 Tax=Rosa chinensis TaxID=74649 RepID=A0A2P6RCI0_ROSCH|nr:uncharacterized protein LOC112194289 [Rosa chinensis]PRQ44126.1 putative tumor suppressing sub-chromosomal transferable candidate 4 [Rosa chinensis]
MQDSFSFRVGKTFDSLPGSWSLGDEKIDRRECNRNNESPEPESELHRYHTYSTDDFCNELENGLLEFFDDKFLVQEEERGWFGQSFESKANPKTKPDDYEEEQWEIKTSIGLDLTLDSEDEEDGYDKLAVGMEDSVDRPDMNEYVNDDDETDSDEVPNLLKGFSGDPLEIGIKSLLKRTSIDDQLVSSTVEKRVRFRDEEEHEGSKDRWAAAVPDYIRNPSRYTHYMFDSSSDMDDKSNEQAYLNFRMQFSRLMKSDTMEAEEVACIAVSKPVALVQRKISTDASKELAPCRIRPIAFPDTDDCEMEEDEPVTGSSSGPEEPACGELSPANFVQTPA